MRIEVCTYTLQSAINAEIAGAYRVELCDNILEGGTTPSFGMIELTRKYISIKLNVIIRPRGGDFLYSGLEFETMLKDIHTVKKLGVDGIAVGVLSADGSVDKAGMKEIISLAKPLSVTFHRAFDCVEDPFGSLDTLMELGVERVLTSGLKKSALEGKEMIAWLVEYAAGRIIIMPGGGINYLNIKDIVKITKAREYHLSGKSVCNSQMVFRNNEVKFNSQSAISEYDYIESDVGKIKSVVDLVNKF